MRIIGWGVLAMQGDDAWMATLAEDDTDTAVACWNDRENAQSWIGRHAKHTRALLQVVPICEADGRPVAAFDTQRYPS